MTKAELKAELKKIGAAQWELANILGVHVQTLINWFHCDKTTAERTEKLKAALEELKNKKQEN